jgi:dTDP-4-amino-4,6-dideoxygalactose transaminase
MLVVNDSQFIKRAEIIWEKGTNRSAFFKGEVDKYGWVDIGSSFLPSEIIAAFLWAQLENMEDIQNRRKEIWNLYYRGLELWAANNQLKMPLISVNATNNAHMFYLVCKNSEQRTALIQFLKSQGIYAVFHYLSLHKSPFYYDKYHGSELTESDRYSDCLLRLPMYYELNPEMVIEKMVQYSSDK